MKKVIESVSQVRNEDQVFSKFSGNEILSIASMNRIRGGDGGEDVWVPPPPKP